SGLPGVTSTQTASSCSRRNVSSITSAWPSWIGLKLPPNSPMRMPAPEGGSSVMPAMRSGGRRVTAAPGRQVCHPSRPRLAVAAHAVFEAGELFHANRPARMHLAGSDADLAAKTKFAAIGKLGRSIMHQNGRVDFVEESFD